MSSTATQLRDALESGALDLPLPGSGATAERLNRLSDLSRCASVSLARLAEAHTDAVAILAEAETAPRPNALYGVWASQDAAQGVTYDATACVIDGTMGFASGLGIVDRALVTARAASGTVLLDVDVSADGAGAGSIVFDTGGWASPALADTATGPITFDRHHVDPGAVLAEPGWYLGRTGFWQGACAPAACWAGGAMGLVEAAGRYVDDNPHRRAHHGALRAQDWTLAALLNAAGDQIDADPASNSNAERVARSLRFAVATACRDVLDRFGRAFGPRPYVHDPAIAQRALDLDLYIKQHHAERELPDISTLDGTP